MKKTSLRHHEISRRTRNELGRLSLQDGSMIGLNADILKTYVKYRPIWLWIVLAWRLYFQKLPLIAGLDEQVVVNRHTANCTTRAEQSTYLVGQIDSTVDKASLASLQTCKPIQSIMWPGNAGPNGSQELRRNKTSMNFTKLTATWNLPPIDSLDLSQNHMSCWRPWCSHWKYLQDGRSVSWTFQHPRRVMPTPELLRLRASRFMKKL